MYEQVQYTLDRECGIFRAFYEVVYGRPLEYDEEEDNEDEDEENSEEES